VGNDPTNYLDPYGEDKYLRDNGGTDASKGLLGLDKDHAMIFGNGKLTIAVSVDVKITVEHKFGDEVEEKVAAKSYIKFALSSTATNRKIDDIHFLQLFNRAATPEKRKDIDMYYVGTIDDKSVYRYRNGKETCLDGRIIMPDGKQWMHQGGGIIKGKDGKSIIFVDAPTVYQETDKKSEVFSASTYIFYKNEALYLVQWELIGKETDGKWSTTYQNIKGNVTAPLPKELNKPSFRMGYWEVDKDGKLSKPIDIKNWFKE
jgi:hypothetical protein